MSFHNDLSDVFPLTNPEVPAGPSAPSVRSLRGFVSRVWSAAEAETGGRVEGNMRGAVRRARCGAERSQGCELSGQSDSGLLLAECTRCAVLHCFQWLVEKELQLCPSSG